METILSFQNVNAGYGRVQILNDLTFEVKKGEVYGVIGPNGCGKTTMFNALIGLIIPTQGTITFDGHNVTKVNASTRCRMGIGRTYQVPRPFEGMSVFENVLVAAVHGAGHSEKDGARIALDALKLTELYDKRETAARRDAKREIDRAMKTQGRIGR